MYILTSFQWILQATKELQVVYKDAGIVYPLCEVMLNSQNPQVWWQMCSHLPTASIGKSYIFLWSFSKNSTFD